MKSPNPRTIACAAALLLLAVTVAVGEAKGDDRARAVDLYEQAKYEEARGILEKLAAEGKANGADLYRLYYCQTVANMPEARETLRGAIQTLESDMTTAKEVEVPFYLSNAYRNLGRLTDMKRVAAAATAKLENGDWPEPKTGIRAFRFGKLYADQDQDDRAADWYGKAVTMLVEEGRGDSTYAKWASRYLGRKAFDGGDYEGAARYYETLLSADAGTVEDLDRLAVAQVRVGDYEAAATAWRRAIILEPATSNRARYAGQLADAAGLLGDLPELSPEGVPWPQLGRADLERTMAEQAGKARELLAGPRQDPSMDKEQRELILAQVTDVRRVFVTAGLEYVLQGYPIRETAFQAGYAPMIFRKNEWQLPPRPRTRAKGKRKGQGKAPGD